MRYLFSLLYVYWLVFTETLQFQSHFFDRRAELTPRTLLPRAQVWGFVKR